MKIYNIEEETKKIEKKILNETHCNMCGKKYDGEFSDLMDIEAFELDFGFGTTYDGSKFKIDLCENCITKWFDSMKIKPERIL